MQEQCRRSHQIFNDRSKVRGIKIWLRSVELGPKNVSTKEILFTSVKEIVSNRNRLPQRMVLSLPWRGAE